MEKIDSISPVGAFGLGVAMSALNIKNLVLSVAAGATITSLPVSSGATGGALIVFTAIAVAPVLVSVVGYLVAGDRLEDTSGGARAWMLRNNAVVSAWT